MNVKYYCEPCNHTAYAQPDTEPACRENKGQDCTMVQEEQFPAPVPKKATATTKKANQ